MIFSDVGHNESLCNTYFLENVIVEFYKGYLLKQKLCWFLSIKDFDDNKNNELTTILSLPF